MTKISDLTPQSRGVDLKVKIVEKQDEREVTAKATGRQHRVAEFLIGDETGSIVMTIWDDGIDKLELGNSYELKNGYVTTFRNSMRMNTGRYGSLEPIDEKIEANTEENVSEKFVEDQRRF